MDENKRIVEIGGVKLEVDLRHARVVENFKIGDNVKVLKKEYSSYKSYPGVIIGFDNFKERPTIVIACAQVEYNSAKLEIIYLNKDTEGLEICPMSRDELVIDKQDAIDKFNLEIAKKQGEIDELNQRKQYFLAKFGQFFEAGSAIEKALNS